MTTDQQQQQPQLPLENNQQEPQTPQLTADEVQAMGDGWVPKDQWKGDPDQWRSAKEFNERGELFSRIKDQSRQLSELKEAMTFLTKQQEQQYRKGFTEAVQQLKQARAQAIEAGDHVAAAELSDKIQDVNQQVRQINQAPAVPQGPSQQFLDWKSQNKWYTTDKTMTRHADIMGLEFRDENPGSTEADMLRYVERKIKEQFPDKFQPKGPPSPDGEARGNESSRGRGESSNSLSSVERSMTDDDKAIMRTIMKSTGMTKEQYLKQYASL